MKSPSKARSRVLTSAWGTTIVFLVYIPATLMLAVFLIYETVSFRLYSSRGASAVQQRPLTIDEHLKVEGTYGFLSLVGLGLALRGLLYQRDWPRFPGARRCWIFGVLHGIILCLTLLQIYARTR